MPRDLRQIGSEMLWNVLQNVNLLVRGNVLIITCNNAGDIDLIDKVATKERIYEALSDFNKFDITVELSAKEKSLDEIDRAADRIKSIFGDDIVVIK